MGDRIELEGNVELPEKLLDNEAYQLGKDVNVTQQTQQRNVVTHNLEPRQANTDARMNEEIHAILQLENASLNKEREHMMNEIKSQRKIIEDIKIESEDIISQVVQENENIKSEFERTKRENNARMAKDIHQLQQKIVNLKSDMDIKVQQLEEKSNAVHKLQEQSINMKNEMQGLREENNNLKGETVRVKQEINDCGEEIRQLQEQNSHMKSDMNIKVGELEEKSNEIHKLQEQSITMQNEMQGLREENIELNGEIIRVKQGINDCLEEIQQLQQENTDMESDVNIKVSQLEEKTKEIQRLQQERTEMQNAMQRVQQNNAAMRSQIQRLQNEMEQKLITDSGSELILGEELGRGAYGIVFKGEFYGTQVAVKEYHEIILSPYYIKNLRREINIASQCRHPNLLQFICATKNVKNCLLIVTELMDTTLRTLLEQRANEMSGLKPQEIKSISLDVARGLNYLHSQKPNPIIHRDISSANVLLWLENSSVKRAKISDYGAANFMELCNTSNPGAILYAAPEATGAKHGPKVCINT